MLLAVVAATLGGTLRVVGFDRDVVDFVLPEHAAPGKDVAFYSFHPDERTVVSGALSFDDPLDPPYTLYGTLPLYLLRAALQGVEWVFGPAQEAATPYRIGRGMSALFSILGLLAVWLLGIHVYGPSTAATAVLFLGLAPMDVQQAHFYTVDSLFALLSTAALVATLRAVGSSSLRDCVAVGCLIGLAASVRLNGLLLLPVLGFAHLLREWRGPMSWRARLLSPRMWAAFAAAGMVMLALQPFLLTAPSLLWEIRGPLDFGHVMRVNRGALLQLWTLQYLHTTPFVYQWTHLLPLGVGWPMTVAFALGLVVALRTPDWRRGAILAWIGLYLITSGPLLAKPVRYLLPIVPPLAVLAAELCRQVWLGGRGGARWGLRLLVAALVAYTAVYGLAFMRVCVTEDSRIQAGRWISRHIPEGATVAVEGGAFSMQQVISRQRYRLNGLDLGLLFYSRGNLLCQSAAGMLGRRLDGAEYLAITDANRQAHVSAAPEVLPVAASFYRNLIDGQLGYRLVKRFKVYPQLWGFVFHDDGAEHSFIGFDHPAVLLFKRSPDAEADRAWEAWVAGLMDEPFCHDSQLIAGTAAIQSGDVATARSLFGQSADSPSSRHLARLLASLAEARAGQFGPDGKDLVVHESMALSLAELGLADVAVAVLTRLSQVTRGDAGKASHYVTIAAHLEDLAYQEHALEVLRLSTVICDNPEARNGLANHAYEAGNVELAVHQWQRSLYLVERQGSIHAHLGRALGDLGRPAEATSHLKRAAELESSLSFTNGEPPR